jgi:MFS family permease
MILGLFPLAAVCFVLISSGHWLAGERRKSLALALLVAVMAGVLFGSLGAGVSFGLITLLGCLTGTLAERGWTYGWQLTALTAIVFSAMALVLAIAWQDMRHEMTIFLNQRVAELKEQPEADYRWMDIIQWYDLNFAYVGVGSVFASVLLPTALMLNLVERQQALLHGGRRRKTTGFQRMRLPDWLVWVAIAVALLWFLDQRWPNDVVRFAAWNAALALSSIYWLGGLAILLYGLAVLNASLPVSLLVVTGLMLLGLMHLLGFIGLFDTWYDFRVRLRRLALRRNAGYGSDENEP